MVPGRPQTDIGAQIERRSRAMIGICLPGGYGATTDDPFEKNFAASQASVVRTLITEIKKRATILKVSGHND